MYRNTSNCILFQRTKPMSVCLCTQFEAKQAKCRQIRYVLWPVRGTAGVWSFDRPLAYSHVWSCFDRHSKAVEGCTMRIFFPLVFVFITFHFPVFFLSPQSYANTLKNFSGCCWESKLFSDNLSRFDAFTPVNVFFFSKGLFNKVIFSFCTVWLCRF